MQPEYLLIDTNYWIFLLTRPEHATSLQKIKELLKEKKLCLLIPDELKKETDRRIKIHVQQEKEKSAPFLKGSDALVKSVHQRLVTELEDRGVQITKLIEGGIFIEPSDAVQLDTMRRYRKDIVPFHRNKNSTSDCLIYFTVIEYLQQNKIEGFYFLTDNSKEFGKPLEDRTTLHDGLIADGITTKYYTSIEAFFITQEILGAGGAGRKSQEASERYIIDVVKADTLNFLDALYLSLQKIHESVSFVPLHILARTSPFRIKQGESAYTYYERFTIHTNNDSLIDFFQQIEISVTPSFKEGSAYENNDDNLKKIHYIINALNHNLVFEIASTNGDTAISIRMPDTGKPCDCIECNYGKMQHSRAARKIIENDYEDSKLKAALTAFQLGFYSKSLELYYDVFKHAEKTGNRLLLFRSMYHVIWVSNFGNYKKSKAEEKMISDIKNFDLDREFFTFATASKFDREMAYFFYDTNFIDYYTAEIREVMEKIQDHYEMQLRGSFSSNSNYSLLITRYAEFETFCRRNAMPFSKFSEAQRLTRLFFKCIFICYSLNEYQSSRILYFDDYILEQLARYGKASEILELHDQYIKNPIASKENKGSDESSFKKLVLNYLLDVDQFIATEKEEHDSFRSAEHDYFEKFWTILTLLSIVRFDEAFIKKCIPLVFSFIPHIKKIRRFDLKYLGHFIAVHGHLLEEQELKRLFKEFISDSTFHDDHVLDAFAHIKKEKPVILIDDEETYSIVKENFLDACKKCNSFHYDILTELHSLMSEQYQQQTKEAIEEQLQEKFNHNVYYQYAIYGIIDVERFKETYLACFNPPADSNRPRHRFFYGETQYHGLSEALNLAFKYKWEVSPEFIAKFKGLSDYYDWLLDMENFDYEKFKPVWVLQYKVGAYFKKMFSVKKVRFAVREYLRKNYQPDIAKYFALYAPENDEN